MGPEVIAALIAAAGSIGGGLLGSKGPKETAIEKQQRKAIDAILEGLQGSGPYASFFQADQDAFQKSIVDPARGRFEREIVPGITRAFAAQGVERGSGIENYLTRAGVDLNDRINAQYLDFTQGAQNRGLTALMNALGASPGFRDQGQRGAFPQALQGYLTSGAFQDSIGNILDAFTGGGGKVAAPTGASKQLDYTPVNNSRELPEFRIFDPRRGYNS